MTSDQPSTRDRRQPREHRGRRFDVQPVHDDRVKRWPISTALPTSTGEPRRRLWRKGPTLDQGVEGACVGHGWTAFLAGAPKRITFKRNVEPAPDEPQEFAFWLYHQAQQVDPWEGEDYDGTSVDAAAEVLMRLGFITSYRWAETREDLVGTLQNVGPLVIAIPWYSGMYDAPFGRLRVSGDQVGWHCLLLNGYDPARVLDEGQAPVEAVRLQNSWSDAWGVEGQAWLPLDELWPLLDNEGSDMCVPLGERFLPRLGQTAVQPEDLDLTSETVGLPRDD